MTERVKAGGCKQEQDNEQEQQQREQAGEGGVEKEK